MKGFIKRHSFSLIFILAVTYLSLFRPPKTSLNEIDHLDKVVHFGMYFVMSSVLWLEYLAARHHRDIPWWHVMVGAMLCPVFYGGFMELLQAFTTTYRSGDWLDFVFNTLGVLSGSAFCYFVVRPLWFRDRG